MNVNPNRQWNVEGFSIKTRELSSKFFTYEESFYKQANMLEYLNDLKVVLLRPRYIGQNQNDDLNLFSSVSACALTCLYFYTKSKQITTLAQQ